MEPSKKRARASGESQQGEYFASIPKIQYEGPESRNPLAFRYYNADEEILGKPMREWLRFSVAYWHTWRGTGSDMFGAPTMIRPWDNDDGDDSLESALKRVEVHFEFLQKIGVEYFCFHDRDIAPEGSSIEETNNNLDAVVALIKSKMQETGIKVLWGTANLFSAPRYMNGAATNPDCHAFAYAAAQVKKCLEISKELGAENYVFWGGREGYQTLLNTDMRKELDHLAAFLRMAVEYKQKIGFTGQFLIEPKPREPTKHQYDFDSATCMSFLKQYGLDSHFKLNIEANHCILAGHTFDHELQLASSYGMLGSVDANTGDPLLGWDTDQFSVDPKETALAMRVVLKQGGLAPGGLNFDCKLRRESTDLDDLVIAHINGMDTFARGLRIAAKIQTDGVLDGMVAERYASFKSSIGAKIEAGQTDFEELENWAKEHGEVPTRSGKQERYEMLLNSYM